MSDVDDILEDADAANLDEDEDDEDKEYGFVERNRSASSTENGCYSKLASLMFGTDVSSNEIKRIMVLSTALFAIQMSDGIFHAVQDPIFGAVVGLNFKPVAMGISFGVSFIILCFYSKVVGCYSRRQSDLFGFFGHFLFALFMLNALFLIHPSVGAIGVRAPDPLRILGWFTFIAIDQFGIIMINLFWSFANSVVPLSSATATYGIVFAIGQLGNLVGSIVFQMLGSIIGVPACFVLGIMSILLFQSAVNKYVEIYGAAPSNELASSCCASCCGCLQGLWLFLKYNYVKGISIITCLYLVQLSVVSMTLEYLIKDHFAQVFGCEQGQSCYNSYTGIHSLTYEAQTSVSSFAISMNMSIRIVSILFAVFGSRAIIGKYGVQQSLLFFPVICLFTSIIFIIYPPNLYMIVLTLLLLEGTAAAINTPLKEMLYIPTGFAIQYKARSWIESLGYDGTQFVGFLFTRNISGGERTFAATADVLSTKGGLLCFVLALLSLAVARCMAREFEGKISSIQPESGEESFINYQNVPLSQDEEGNEDDDVELPSIS